MSEKIHEFSLPGEYTKVPGGDNPFAPSGGDSIGLLPQEFSVKIKVPDSSGHLVGVEVSAVRYIIPGEGGGKIIKEELTAPHSRCDFLHWTPGSHREAGVLRHVPVGAQPVAVSRYVFRWVSWRCSASHGATRQLAVCGVRPGECAASEKGRELVQLQKSAGVLMRTNSVIEVAGGYYRTRRGGQTAQPYAQAGRISCAFGQHRSAFTPFAAERQSGGAGFLGIPGTPRSA